ncbi:MAG TPA: serine/threonine-protein kinase, partial [Chitinivibrionales bacterium]
MPNLGLGGQLDVLMSRVGEALPLRFHVEIPRKDAASRTAEFARIRETFIHHVPAFEIGAHIGSGGFADVFLVTSNYDGVTDFAIKVLRKDLLNVRKRAGVSPDQEEMRIKDVKKRFTNESYVQWHLSRSLSQEVAQSVVQVYDHGEFDRKQGYRFILMEQMGHTVRQFISEIDHGNVTPLLMHYKVDLMINIAVIITRIHKEGIIHRDIKPENILFIRPGRQDAPVNFGDAEAQWPSAPVVKLGDFGTVRWVRSYSSAYDAIIIGSQSYMSPEQMFDPENLNSRTDIYSFGVVCYELLFGVHPKGIRTTTR